MDDEKFFALKVEQDLFRRSYRMDSRFSGSNNAPESISHTGTQIRSLISALKQSDRTEQVDLLASPCIFAIDVNPLTAELQVMPVPILPDSGQEGGAEIFSSLLEMKAQFEFLRKEINQKFNKDIYPNLFLLIKCFLWYAKKQILRNSEFLREDANAVLAVLESLELAPSRQMREFAAKKWLDAHPNFLLFDHRGEEIPKIPDRFLTWLESEEAEHVLPLNYKKIRAEIQNNAESYAQGKKDEFIETLVAASANTGQYRAIRSARDEVGKDIARIELLSPSGVQSEEPAQPSPVTAGVTTTPLPLPPNSAPLPPFRTRKATTDPQGSTFFNEDPATKKLFTIPPNNNTSE